MEQLINKRYGDLRTFLILWAGQAVSLVGTGMTRFAMLVWAYQVTGEATALALLGFFSFILYILFSPLAGVIVDRHDRRLVMLLADTGAGMMTLLIATLFWSGELALWHLYLAEALTGALEAFQRPAYIASSSVLVPKRLFSRLNALRSLAFDGANILAPFFAGLLLANTRMGWVFVADIATFGVAVITLSIIRIPMPDKRPENTTVSFREEITFGARYIFRRPGLLGLMLLMFFINLIATLTYFGILGAMILARSGGDELALATVQAALGAAGVVGAVVLGVWGGPKKQIPMLIGTMAVSFLFGDFLIGTGQHLGAWVFGAIVAAFFIPFIVSADRTIWQKKVALDVQGRVMSARATIVEGAIPIGFLIAGPLADRLFEPAMRLGLLRLPLADLALAAWKTPLADGTLVDRFGWLVGTGPGAGMGLMFVCTAVLGMTVTLGFYAIPAVRHVEDDLPDFDEGDQAAIDLPHPVVPLPGD